MTVTCSLNCALDLNVILNALVNIEMKSNFTVKRTKKPFAAILIYPNGKMVIIDQQHLNMLKRVLEN
jgi:TATA-box binding protein (TBP) (component of TFIID and TFIIIB)